VTWDTLLIDGFDLTNLCTVVETFEVDGSADSIGGNYSVPGRDGEVWRQKARGVGAAPVGIAILPTDPVTGIESLDPDERIAQFNRNWADIKRRVLVRRRPLTLSRRLSLPEGDTTITAQAEIPGGLSAARINASTARAVLPFRLLDGCWFDEDSTSVTVTPSDSAFVRVSGTTDTANMTVTLTTNVAGPQVLTNVSAGVSLTYTWPPELVGSSVRVDAWNYTVRRYPPGSTDYISSHTPFDHAGDKRFMVLDPGVGGNELTLSAGSAVVEYRGAWL